MRWIFRIVSALVVVAFVAVGALAMLPADRIAKLLTDQFKAATGRTLAIQGDIKPSFWPDLGITTGAFTVSNAAWSDAGPMIQADGLSVGVDIPALWGGAIRIKDIEAIAPKILLEVNKNGTGNWELPTTASEAAVSGGGAAGPTAAPNFALDFARIVKGRITYLDRRTGSRTGLSGITGTLEVPDFAGPASFNLSAAMNGQPFDVDGRIASLSNFLSQGSVGTSFDLSVGRARIAYNGIAGLIPLAAGGKIDADLSDQKAVFALMGHPVPGLPIGFGRDKLKASGDITLKGARMSLRDAVLQLDHNALTGSVQLVMNATPTITADLRGGALDFTALMSSQTSGGGSADATQNTGWSKDRFDVSALQMADVDLNLVAQSIDLGIAKFGTTHTSTALDRGRAVTEVKQLAAYNGDITGSFVINSRGGLSARTNLRGAGVALQPLLIDMVGYDRLIGSGNLTLNVLAVGDDMDTLMRSLSGDGAVKIGKGELRGLDLAGMLRNLDPSYVGQGSKTIFKDLKANFTLNGGVLRNEDLLLNASVLTAAGKGKLDIGAKAIDYRMSAKLLENQTKGGVWVPIIIKGPWSAPKFKLDLEALAKEEFAEEIEQVKSVVETAVIKKVKEETGINLENLDNLNNIEDKLKKELEDRAVEGVLKLFGR